ncbi:MAG: sialate O-acetylesterase [Phycisphaerae bacterium]|nr:sialate O-acetylesterase [Phycisphaerae bacterium]
MIARKTLLTVCVLAFGVSLTGAKTQSPPAGKGPVRVFLLMGQSNMNGRGNIKVLNEKITKDLPDKYPPSLTRMRTDVWITGANGNGVSNQMSNVRLEPGFAQFGYFGPELAFGHAMGDHYEDEVLLIKIFGGGTPLATHWTSPSSAKRTKRQGPLKGRRAGFQSAYYKTKKALDDLPKLIEGYDPKRGYQIMGVVWVHGNADGGKFAKEYEDNLTDFITDIRELFGLPKLPFIAVESLSSRAPGSSFKNAVDRVNKKTGDKQAAAILTKSKINLRGDKAYSVYNASGDSAHWKHNGRAYLDVGYWSAELMKPLLAKTANHATDEKVQAALKKYGRLFEEGNAANKDPVYEAAKKRWGGRPPMKTAGGNNIKRKK